MSLLIALDGVDARYSEYQPGARPQYFRIDALGALHYADSDDYTLCLTTINGRVPCVLLRGLSFLSIDEDHVHCPSPHTVTRYEIHRYSTQVDVRTREGVECRFTLRVLDTSAHAADRPAAPAAPQISQFTTLHPPARSTSTSRKTPRGSRGRPEFARSHPAPPAAPRPGTWGAGRARRGEGNRPDAPGVRARSRFHCRAGPLGGSRCEPLLLARDLRWGVSPGVAVLFASLAATSLLGVAVGIACRTASSDARVARWSAAASVIVVALATRARSRPRGTPESMGRSDDVAPRNLRTASIGWKYAAVYFSPRCEHRAGLRAFFPQVFLTIGVVLRAASLSGWRPPMWRSR